MPLRCEIKVDRLKNFDLDLRHGSLFVRYYVHTGDGLRIRIETSSAGPSWGETAAIDVSRGASEQLLEPHAVAFELRWRRPAAKGSALLRRLGAGSGSSSKLLGRAEVAWKEVLAAPGRELKRCVGFEGLRSEFRGAKAPSMAVEMRVDEAVDAAEKKMWRRRRQAAVEECGCRSSEWFGTEEDVALVAATLNAW